MFYVYIFTCARARIIISIINSVTLYMYVDSLQHLSKTEKSYIATYLTAKSSVTIIKEICYLRSCI